MANDVTKIVVTGPKGSGAWLTAIAGTAIPTTLTGSVNAAFHSLGFIGEDGITENIGDSTNIIREMGGSPVRTVTTENDVTYSFVALETNEYTMALRHGAANVTKTAASGSVGEELDWKLTADQLPIQPHIIELVDGTKTIRGVLPKAQVYERGETKMGVKDPRSYSFGIRCYPDASGVKAYWYSNDNVTV